MITTFAYMFLLGLTLSALFKKLKLPSFLGMILTGVILHQFNLIDPIMVSASADLKEIALIVILTRAGLELNLKELKSVGRSALLMCFVPAFFEIAGTMIIAPALFGFSLLESALLGSVLAAVSPAVVVPRMLKMIEEKRGTKKGIPQLIMAAASVDDVLVVVIFTSILGILNGDGITPSTLIAVPLSVIIGILTGILSGIILSILFDKVHIRDSSKVIILLGFGFAFITLQDHFVFSGLIAVMALGATIYAKKHVVAERLSSKFSKVWVAAELILFVLVGASVDISYLKSSGIVVAVAVVGILLFRIVGVLVCFIGTNLNKKEVTFCAFSFIPKATVQAAIGGIPLAMGLSSGNIIATTALMAILITAPIGSILIDLTYKKLIEKSTD